MTRVEMKIEELENNGKVIKNVKFEDGKVMNIEMVESFEYADGLEYVDLDAYEANGYSTEGLEGNWILFL